MNTHRSLRARMNVLAAAVAVGGAIAIAGTAYADSAQTMPNDITSAAPHQGPGVGSTKTPPFFDAAQLNQQAQLRGELLFHTTDNQAAQQPTQQHQGPGPWSSKAPGIH